MSTHSLTARSRLFVRIGFYLLVALICLIMVFPFYWMIIGSLQTTMDIFDLPRLIPLRVSLSGYRELFVDRPIFPWLLNSLLVAVFSVVIASPIAILAGVSLSRYRYRFRLSMLYLVLFTQLLPAPVILIPLYITMQEIGLVDSLLGLIMVDVGISLPLSVWMMKNFFDYIPPAIEEQARIDGCSDLGVLFRILIPLALPGLIAIIVFIFIVAWGEYVLSYTLITTTKNWVYTIALPHFQSQFDIQWGELMAATIFFVIPPIVLFLSIQRYFIQGLTRGSVKE